MCCCHGDGCRSSRWADKTVGQSELRRQEPAELQLMLPGCERKGITVITCTHRSGLEIRLILCAFLFHCVENYLARHYTVQVKQFKLPAG